MKSERMETNLLIEGTIMKTLDKIYIRRTNDFIEPIAVNIDEKITDVELQCQGYSLFDPESTLDNFLKYFSQLTNIIKRNKNIVVKSLKINLNGFKISKNFIAIMSKEIHEIGLNIKTLWIHTSDLQNVTLQDFVSLLNLMIGVGHGMNQNFEDYSLQCANWVFYPRQPNFRQFKSVFQNIVGSLDGVPLNQKHIRLEFSGWWYRKADAKMFLGYNSTKEDLKQIPKHIHEQYTKFQRSYDQSKDQFNKQVAQFHIMMQFYITKLLQIMEDIQELEIDMRNMNQLLQMKKLKQSIITCTIKEQRVQKSLISMRQTANMNQGQQSEKKFRLNVVV